MTIELRPLGVNCNLGCQYCYQNPIRDAGNFAKSYDVAAMKAALASSEQPFALFGGEPLLLPKEDLEDLLAWGFERHGMNTMQTNGVLINDHHIQLFKQYQVYIGISFDGPGALNDLRWAGSLEKTRAATVKTENAIARLCAEGINVSLIITLHRGNATADKLPILHEYLHYLVKIGVKRVRLHILEVENSLIRELYTLSTAENLTALLSFARLEEELPSNFLDIFHDLKHLIRGRDDRTSCVWRGCDPYTTVAVSGVEGHGQRSNCGRTNKDGVDFVKAQTPGFERYLALYHTPQTDGGCQGCRFFIMCKGQCPGTAIDGDWRNRTEYCDLWKALFTYFEENMLSQNQIPISQHPQLTEIEQEMLKIWAEGHEPIIPQIMMNMNLPISGL